MRRTLNGADASGAKSIRRQLLSGESTVRKPKFVTLEESRLGRKNDLENSQRTNMPSLCGAVEAQFPHKQWGPRVVSTKIMGRSIWQTVTLYSETTRDSQGW